jgi:hypothetical protein
MTEEDLRELAAKDFPSICREALGPYLEAHGFTVGAMDFASVGWRRGSSTLRIHHLPEESPKYSPMVELGFTTFWSRLSGRVYTAGLWRLIPKDAPPYSEWWFTGPEDLPAILHRIRDEVLDVHARPLWEDPRRLRALVEEADREWIALRRAEQRR